MKELFGSIRDLLKKNFLTLVLFEVVFRIATFLCGLQCIRLLLRISLEFTGFSHLTVENYDAFILHPVTIAGGIILMIILLFFMHLEMSSLMVCYQYSRAEKHLHISDMALLGVRQAVRAVKKNKISWIFTVALAFPFLNIQFLVREVSYFKILNYTVQRLYRLVHNVPVLVLAGVLILLVSYFCMFGLPFYYLDEHKSSRGLREGISICRKRGGGNIMGALILQAAIVGILLVMYVLAMAFAVFYARETRMNSVVVPTILIYSDWIRMAVGIMAGALGTVLGTAFIYSVYSYDRESAETAGTLGESRPALLKINKVWRRWIAAVITCTVILAEAGYIWYLTGQRTQISEEFLTGTLITAHRGGAKKAPENTLSALDYAKGQLADYAEIDVQETKEGVVVLLHDSSLKRTTGVDKNIWELNYFQIQKLDAGKKFGEEFEGERIPTLQQAIDFCGNDLQLNVEIKYNGENQDIVQKVVKIFEKNDIVETAILSSMNYNFLQEAKKLNPSIRTSYVMGMTYGSMVELKYADYVSIRSSYVDKDLVQEVHRLGKSIHAWTVNTRYGMERMRYYGIDNLITDDPAMARQIFYGEGQDRLEFLELLKYAL